MDRREFIKICCISCFGSVAMSAMLQSCGAQYYAQNTISGNQLILNKSEFIRVDKDKTTIRQYVLIKSDKYPFPIALYRHNDDEFTALLMKCTHKGCELNAHAGSLSCPCHGSEFSNKGKVLSPPAEEDLTTFEVRHDNEKIYIHI